MSGVKDMNEISTVDFFPWAWMLHFARAFLSFNVVNALTKRKYGMLKTFIIYIGVCMVYSYATLQLKDMSQKVEYTCLTLYFLIQFVLVIFLTENKLYLKLISVISAFLTMLLTSALYYSFITLTFGKEGTEAFLNKTTLLSLICLCLFMVAFSFFVVFIIKVIKNKLNNTLEHNIKYIYFYLFPLTHIFAIQIVYAFEQQLVTKANEYPQRLSSVSCIYFVVCFIIDFSIMFAIDFFEKRELENLKYKQLAANNELDYQKYLQLKTERERYRKIRHDISNILTTAVGFIEIEKPQKALEILQKANDDIHNSAYEIICKNETINTIYTIKHRQAEEKGINLVINVEENAEIKISNYDLCRILTNLIDNQIEATDNFSENRDIELFIKITPANIVIKSTNMYKNSSKKKPTNKDFHGYGQKIINDIAKKYNGKFKFSVVEDKYITSTLLDNIECLN